RRPVGRAVCRVRRGQHIPWTRQSSRTRKPAAVAMNRAVGASQQMPPLVPTVIVVALLGTLAWEVLPTVLRTHAGRLAEYAQRKAFIEDERALLVKYPFLGETFASSYRYVADGTWLPALEAAWRTNSLLNTVRAVGHWLANNFVVRMLSPQTPAEMIALALVLALIVYCSINAFASTMLARSAQAVRMAKYQANMAKLNVKGSAIKAT